MVRPFQQWFAVLGCYRAVDFARGRVEVGTVVTKRTLCRIARRDERDFAEIRVIGVGVPAHVLESGRFRIAIDGNNGDVAFAEAVVLITTGAVNAPARGFAD